MPKRPFKLRELLQRLQPYGIEVLDRKRKGKRGKGSELILLKPDAAGSRKGPQYPVKNHGSGTEISVPVLNAILRRFQIDKKEFWH